MNKRAFAIIEESLTKANDAGLNILGGPLFHWASNNMLVGCSAFGAVLWYNDNAHPNFPAGWLKDLCDTLKVGTFWFWRFNQGWVQMTPVRIIIEKNGKERILVDPVSTASAKLARRHRSNT